jgi:hypothetical protein
MVDPESESFSNVDGQLMLGVTSEEIDTLKQTANSAIHDSLLKKIHEIDQVLSHSRYTIYISMD